jgi:hypothetical protein
MKGFAAFGVEHFRVFAAFGVGRFRVFAAFGVDWRVARPQAPCGRHRSRHVPPAAVFLER